MITNSIIQGRIYTARLHGGTAESAAALTIYDSKLGIVFKTGFENEVETGEEKLRITNNGFSTGEYLLYRISGWSSFLRRYDVVR